MRGHELGIYGLIGWVLSVPQFAVAGMIAGEAIVLHPDSETSSFARCADGSTQGGYVWTGPKFHAALWDGSSASVVDMNPVGADGSTILGMSNGQQAGAVSKGNRSRASTWNGTAESWRDIHPESARDSWAFATDGIRQAGYVNLLNGRSRASLWAGTSESWVNLHPANYYSSLAWDISGEQQVGFVATEAVASERASLWRGSAAAWTMLHPPTAQASEALATDGTHQVGWVRFDVFNRASLWSDTAASRIDLHPDGFFASEANDLVGVWQVGRVRTPDGAFRASLWSGSTSSWFDLSTFTPNHTATVANAVSLVGETLYIAGGGTNRATFKDEAILWIIHVPAPSSFSPVLAFAVASLRRPRRMANSG